MASTISATAAVLDGPYSSSQAAQVHRLNQRGETPAQIASILSLPLATVDRDLGITVQAAGANAIPGQTALPARTGAAQTQLSIFG